MSSVPNRADLTKWLSLQIANNGQIVVGLAVAPSPPEAGWSDDPQSPGSYFTPYIVLTPLASNLPTGPIGDSTGDWTLPYAMESFGTLYLQVEGQADKARRIVSGIGRVTVSLGGENWRIKKCKINTIGGIEVDRSVKPLQIQQRDTIVVEISRSSDG